MDNTVVSHDTWACLRQLSLWACLRSSFIILAYSNLGASISFNNATGSLLVLRVER